MEQKQSTDVLKRRRCLDLLESWLKELEDNTLYKEVIHENIADNKGEHND